MTTHPQPDVLPMNKDAVIERMAEALVQKCECTDYGFVLQDSGVCAEVALIASGLLEEIDRLKHDVERQMAIANAEAAEVERLLAEMGERTPPLRFRLNLEMAQMLAFERV